MNNFDLVALQELADIIGQVLHHLVLTGHHGRQVEGQLAGFDAVLGKSLFGKVIVLAGVEQRLARNAAHPQAHAAEALLLFHTGNPHVELGCPHRRHVTTGTAADDHEIEFFCLGHG